MSSEFESSVGQETFAKAREMLIALGVTFGQTPDGLSLVVRTATGGFVRLGSGEIDDAEGEMWPVSLLDLPLLLDVDPASFPAGLIGYLNNDIMIGKVCLEGTTLLLRHEVVGWPGAAEWQVSIQALIGHAGRMLPLLTKTVKGSPPPTYDDLAAPRG